MFGAVRVRGWPAGVWLAGAIASMVPDLDVIGFSFGVRYGDLLGHRGLTHSLVFAAVLATLFAMQFPSPRRPVWLFLFACTASHGLLDAATDGGLGIAFFSPFSNQRYFWPWRPIVVSPIGVGGFFSDWGLAVIQSELVWIWLPCVALMAVALVSHQRLRLKP